MPTMLHYNYRRGVALVVSCVTTFCIRSLYVGAKVSEHRVLLRNYDDDGTIDDETESENNIIFVAISYVV